MVKKLLSTITQKTEIKFNSLRYNNFFSNDFVLQGVAKTGEQTKLDIIKDLKNFNGSSVLDDVVVESKCILADTDTWLV